MIDTIYYDRFTHQGVLEKEPTAPPERYAELIRIDNDINIEKWCVTDEDCNYKFMFISYLKEDMPNVKDIRMNMAEKNKVELKHMVRLYLPSDRFDVYVKYFELKEREKDD